MQSPPTDVAPPTSPGPAWLRQEAIDRLVTRAAREIQPLSTLTPVDVRRERNRLVDELTARRRAMPRWTYAPRNHDELRRALDAADRRLTATVDGALDELYLARIRELSLEAALCAAAGTSHVGRLARERFAPDAHTAEAASALCAEWLGEAERPSDPVAARLTASDDPRPHSLLSRMRAAVGRLRLPFAVVPTPALAPIAATGERAILVATGRLLSDEDAARTVCHEIEGHALPRARSLQAKSVLFRAGTARGVDDQEGRAILIEQRAGWLGHRRRHHLAARHRAVQAMLQGASFADVAATLFDAHGLDASEAIVVAERAFRGGDGRCPGLGRESIYLESFVRVHAHLAAAPDDEHVLASGQVAVGAIPPLRTFAPDRAEAVAPAQ
jgi:hypothetical protein